MRTGNTFTTGVDKLDLASTLIANNVTSINGIDSDTIRSHNIVNGLIRFDDSDGYIAPITITAGNLSNVFSYLQSNITTAGNTVAFNAMGNTYVFQDGGFDDTLVQLTGITANSINASGLAVGTVWVS